MSRAVPGIAPAPAIALENIQPARPTIAPISVASLATEPITLAPLDIRAGGRH